MRRISQLSLCALVLGTGVVATGAVKTSAAAKKQVTTITYWHEWSGHEAAAEQKLVDEFNKTHPDIHVNVLASTTDQKELTAMTGGNPPDVALTFSWSNVPKWASVGALAPLDSYVKSTNMNLKDFVSSTVKLGQYNGTLYGVPYETDTMMLFYNKKMFKAAGIAHPPKTISEMKADALKLTKLNADGSYKQLGFIPDYPGLDDLIWRYAFGADFYNPATKKITVDSAKSIAALDFERSFYQKPWDKQKVQKFKSGFGKYMSPNNPFFMGQLGMDLDGEWYPTFIEKYAPNLDYGVAPIPYPDGHPELANSGWALPAELFIPTGAAHKDAAWTFINWLLQPKQMNELCGQIGNLPTRLSALDDPSLIKMSPGLKPFLQYAKGKNIHGFPNVTFSNEYLTALSVEDQKALNLEETSQQAMQNVVNQVQKLVK